MRLNSIEPWCSAVFWMIIMRKNVSNAICCHECFQDPTKHIPANICTLNNCDTDTLDEVAYNPCKIGQVNIALVE